MKKIAFLVAVAAAFGLAPLASILGPVAGAALLVVLAITLALALSGTFSAVAIATGALAALAAGVLHDASPVLAGAVLLAVCGAERSMRVRAISDRLVHAGALLAVGAVAGALTSHFAAADLTVQAVVLSVAAVLACAPLLIDADDPLAHALDGLADDLPEPAKASLEEGAELRRTVDDAILDRRAARHVGRTWENLLRLGQARLNLELPAATGRRPSPHAGAVAKRLDERIGEHVTALTRAYTAVDAAKAAEVSLEDEDLRNVENHGESLEEMSRAIVEDMA